MSNNIAALILNLTLGRDEWPVLRPGLLARCNKPLVTIK
jgi:hypothetical protein